MLSGGSAFGLDAVGGVQAALRENGRGFEVAGQLVPIVPGAILFDLANGGDKDFWREPPYWRLGHAAAQAAADDFALGSHRRRPRRDRSSISRAASARPAPSRPTAFASARWSRSMRSGRRPSATPPHFWAAPYERDGEFGGLGWPAALPDGSAGAER